MSVIQQRLRERRLYSGLTLGDVAKKLGITEATVQRYESGKIANIPHETIEELALIYECNPAFLMGWVDDPAVIDEETGIHEEPDPEFRMIARARKDMTPADRKKMVEILQAAFKEYFKDGHIVLGHITGADPHNLQDGVCISENTIFEREADYFASMLLAYPAVLNACGAGTPQDIAELCGISMSAAENRLASMQRSIMTESLVDGLVLDKFKGFIMGRLDLQRTSTGHAALTF